MKNLKKLTRGNLKNIKGGISIECIKKQESATACYTTMAACQADPNSSNPDTVLIGCEQVCNKYCYF
ncbi:bacteriocin-like protein [Chryseobacterium sp. MMS23-Vi53]|uniref:bacteriocin-like protein n=1 Tax=Chryseobacterium sp. MMS23-Vi53 TaxID=3386644 RepID=UPI0039EB4A26